MRKTRKLKDLLKNKKRATDHETKKQPDTALLSGVLQEDLERLKNLLDHSSDIIYREFQLSNAQNGILIFLDGFVDRKRIHSDIINPLMTYKTGKESLTLEETEQLQNRIATADRIRKGNKIQEAADEILAGNTALLIDGIPRSLFISTTSREQRSIEEPASESVIRGPREGFTENIRTNTSLVRRRLKTSKLKMEEIKIGHLSKTNVVMTYLDGIAEPSLVEEVRNRLNRIEIDAIEESGYIEELIEDNPYSVFPQVMNTERPDRVTGCLLEGKIGIIVDNTPFALVVPITFFELMTASEDYYGRYTISSAIRLLRYLFLLIALFLPSIYIAVTTFHLELLPTNLLFSVAASRETVPFPAIVEALLMEISFEALREAGVRLPKPVGQAVSIVGALVIGEAAVQAGIVSAPLVIVVAITGIASFMLPSYSLAAAIRLIRFGMMLLTAVLGLYGLLLGVFFLLIHVARLRSFGVPYSSPIAPLHVRDLKDVFIRAPWWAMITRPDEIPEKNRNRMRKFLRPRPANRNK